MASLNEILAQKQPEVKTRQALLVIGLQTDFVAANGKLPVDTTTGFLGRLLGFIPRFRDQAGDVVWVQTTFSQNRAVNDGSGDGDQVFAESMDLLDGFDDDSIQDVDDDSHGQSRSHSPLASPSPRNSTGSTAAAAASPSPKKPNKHTQRAMELLRNMRRRNPSAMREILPMPGSDDEADADEELFLSSPSKNGPCCVQGTPGAQFAPIVAPHVDRTHDTIVNTSYYSAFNASTGLLLQLRSKLVTHIYLCGCITNISVHATALDAARHGFTINLIEDCLGYRKLWRHEEALRQMHEIMAAQLVTSSELLADLSLITEEREVPKASGDVGDALAALADLKITNPSENGSQTGSSKRSKSRSRKGKTPADLSLPAMPSKSSAGYHNLLSNAEAHSAPSTRALPPKPSQENLHSREGDHVQETRELLKHQKSQTLHHSKSKQTLVKGKIRMRSRSDKEKEKEETDANVKAVSSSSKQESGLPKEPAKASSVQTPKEDEKSDKSRPSSWKSNDRRQKSTDVSASPSYVQRLRNSLSQASLTGSRSKRASGEPSPSRSDKKHASISIDSTSSPPPLPRPTSLPGFKSKHSAPEASPTRPGMHDRHASAASDRVNAPLSPTLSTPSSKATGKAPETPPPTRPHRSESKASIDKPLPADPPNEPSKEPPAISARKSSLLGASKSIATAPPVPDLPPPAEPAAPERTPPAPPPDSQLSIPSQPTLNGSGQGKKPGSLATLPTLGPDDRIAEGDSRIIYDFFSPGLSVPELSNNSLVKDEIFSLLYNEVRWQKMFHAQGEVPRLVCVQGEFGEDGSMPVYRHPSDQSMHLLHFTPAVQLIRERVEELVHHPVNHVLIQLYRSGNDYISEHSDKTLDITRDTSIVNVSFGAQRTMRLRTKKSAKVESEGGEATAVAQRTVQRIPMPHNSMFVLGHDSNMRWVHGIMADKRMSEERSDLERAYSGKRISLTFRNIGTFLDNESKTIWGQGATGKDRASSNAVINDDETETQELVHAFGKENQSSEFDWDEVYGPGFDILHFRSPPQDDPMLFLSNDEAENQSISLCLSEMRVSHTTNEPPQLEKDFEDGRLICFRDTDGHHTEIEGVVPILLYLDRYKQLDRDDRGKLCTATAYDLLFQHKELQSQWRSWKSQQPPPSEDNQTRNDSVSSDQHPIFLNLLQNLERKQKRHGGKCIAGMRFTIADCALWPLLDEVIDQWPGWTRAAFPHLTAYYEGLYKSRRAVARLRKSLPHIP